MKTINYHTHVITCLTTLTQALLLPNPVLPARPPLLSLLEAMSPALQALHRRSINPIRVLSVPLTPMVVGAHSSAFPAPGLCGHSPSLGGTVTHGGTRSLTPSLRNAHMTPTFHLPWTVPFLCSPLAFHATPVDPEGFCSRPVPPSPCLGAAMTHNQLGDLKQQKYTAPACGLKACD